MTNLNFFCANVLYNLSCLFITVTETSTAGLALITNVGTLIFGVSVFSYHHHMTKIILEIVQVFMFCQIVGMAGVFSQNDPDRAKAMTWVLTGLLILSM